VRQHGPIDVLINNAGYGQLGPFEFISDEELRRQFEVNVFALARLSRLVIPAMRTRGRGKIIHIGSVVGKFTYPLGAAYCSSKHAVESIADAMRLELAPFGISVILVEPGTIGTRFFENAERRAHMPGSGPDEPYRFLNHAIPLVLGNWARRRASPEEVARVVLKVMAARRPSPRHVVTWEAKALLLLRRLLPDRAVDFLVRKIFKIPN
jgi:NAD(P)-dependent dehydrogenase (short-subunit alcohol dehydrogenase family)